MTDVTASLPQTPLAVNDVAAAKLLGIGLSTLQRWRVEGKGPPYARLGGKRVVYRVTDLERWLMNSTKTASDWVG